MLERLTDRVLYLPADHRTDRPILAAVRGAERTLMGDAGASWAHARAFLDALRAATGRSPDLVALSHWHWDHTFGLATVGAVSIGQRNIARSLSRLRGLAWDDESLARRVAAGEESAFIARCLRREYGAGRDIRIALPTVLFDESLTLDLGGLTCDLYHVPTDHADDAVAIHVREEGVLFVGDAFGPRLDPSPDSSRPYYTVEGTLAALRFARSLGAAWLFESHSAPATPDVFERENVILEIVAECVRAGATEREPLRAAVARRIARSLTADDEDVVECFLAGLGRKFEFGRRPRP